MMRVLGVIPARWASTRFPGKPLAMIRGRSMVMRVYERAEKSGIFDKVIVATEDERILAHVHASGGNAIMTSTSHQSGTERCAEALELMIRKTRAKWDAVINIQGDEPLIDAGLLRLLADEFHPGGEGILTLAAPITHENDLADPNVVKLVRDKDGNALYFSRSPIPYVRNQEQGKQLIHGLHLRHLGLYAYYSKTLLEIARLQPDPLEKAESLEQLRWLSHGYKIRVLLSDNMSQGVDIPEDIKRVEALLDD